MKKITLLSPIFALLLACGGGDIDGEIIDVGLDCSNPHQECLDLRNQDRALSQWELSEARLTCLTKQRACIAPKVYIAPTCKEIQDFCFKSRDNVFELITYILITFECQRGFDKCEIPEQ